ncbi:MAG TPA: DUF5989 family protein [Alphaproteobacteria bacterium]|jgi:hypothetical protein
MASPPKERIRYMRARRKWWPSPVLIALRAFGGLRSLAQNSAIARLIGTAF